MPFTDAWSDLIPDDNTDAKLLGADVRQLRLDIHERLAAALVVDWTTDPLVVQPSISGKRVGIIVTVPFCAFASGVDDSVNGFVTVNTGFPIVAPIRVPYGCTITQMSVLCNPGAGDTLTLSIYRRAFTNVLLAGASVSDLPCNAAGLQVTSVFGINHIVDPVYYYWLRAANAGPGAASLYAVQLSISRDSNDFST